MKMEINMKNTLHIYDIIRPRFRKDLGLEMDTSIVMVCTQI